MKIQPAMPPEVNEQREINLKTIVKGISNTLGECGKLLDEIVQIWTSLQEDLNIQKIEDDIQQKYKWLEEIQEIAKAFLVLQKLARIC